MDTQTVDVQQWDYLAENFPFILFKAGQPNEKLERLGTEGWELVSATPYGGGSALLFFKRPKR